MLKVRTSAGFTLMELLVVVAIIGMMTAAITISTSSARVQSRDAKRKADLANVAASLEVYFSELRAYPDASTTWTWDGLKSKLYPTYLNAWPTDPTGVDGMFGTGFVYQTNAFNKPVAGSSANTQYVLDVTLEGKEEPTNSQILCDISSNTNPNFYLSGTQTCNGKTHYRIASPK
jgi:prepilin-type N-terminal cleavage/methylation domain-containing protein